MARTPVSKGWAYILYGGGAFILSCLAALPFGYLPLRAFGAVADSRDPARDNLYTGWVRHMGLGDAVAAAMVYALPLALLLAVTTWHALMLWRVRGRWATPFGWITYAGLLFLFPICYPGAYWVGLLITAVYCAVTGYLFVQLFERRFAFNTADWKSFRRLAWLLWVPWIAGWAWYVTVARLDAPLGYLLSLRDLGHSGCFLWMRAVEEGYYRVSPIIAVSMNFMQSSFMQSQSALQTFWVDILRLACLLGLLGGLFFGVPYVASAVCINGYRTIRAKFSPAAQALSLFVCSALVGYTVVVPFAVGLALSLSPYIGPPGASDLGSAGPLRLYIAARRLAIRPAEPLDIDSAEMLKGMALGHASPSVRYWSLKALAKQKVDGWENVLTLALDDPSVLIRANALRDLPPQDGFAMSFAESVVADPAPHPYLYTVCKSYLGKSRFGPRAVVGATPPQEAEEPAPAM